MYKAKSHFIECIFEKDFMREALTGGREEIVVRNRGARTWCKRVVRESGAREWNESVE